MNNNINTGQSLLAEILCEGMIKSGLDPVEYPTDSFVEFTRLLIKWNAAYNLTSICKPEDMVTHHLLDSLSVVPFVSGNKCLDAGTGAGFPGMILAMSRPEQSWLLVDSIGKKIRFLQQAIIELKITNVTLAHSRVEAVTSDSGFTTITARALGSIRRSYQICHHLIRRSSGKLLLMKGADIKAELEEMTSEPVIIKVIDLDVPELEGKRKLVEISSLPPAI